MSILGDIFKVVTGPVGSAIGLVGDVASGLEGNRQKERQVQGQNDLEAARLNLQAPGMRASNSVRGDILANAQPVSITGPLTHTGGKMPTITGGLSPSLFSNNTRQLGQNMSRDALLSQMQGPIQPPQPNGFDTALNGLGLAGLVGAAGQLAKPQANGMPFTPSQPGNPNLAPHVAGVNGLPLPYNPLPFTGWQQ